MLITMLSPTTTCAKDTTHLASPCFNNASPFPRPHRPTQTHLNIALCPIGRIFLQFPGPTAGSIPASVQVSTLFTLQSALWYTNIVPVIVPVFPLGHATVDPPWKLITPGRRTPETWTHTPLGSTMVFLSVVAPRTPVLPQSATS